MKKQLAGVIKCLAPNKKCGITMMWYKNFIKMLIFDFYMLCIVFLRLLCKAMSKVKRVAAFKKVL